MLLKATAALLLLGRSLASPIDTDVQVIQERQSCPAIHLFGARETTVAPGYGTSATFINLVIQAHPGATEEAINYPACGGQASCGSVSYASSVVAGIQAVTSQVNSYNAMCPNTILILVGYSQGGQIMDDALCGGGDTNEGYTNTAVTLSAAAVKQVAAAIFAGDPRHIPGLPYNVGTCQASGFAPRPAGFTCPSAAKIQSYCDSTDPYCCNGSDAATHEGYGIEYGQAALTFINGKIAAFSSGGGGTTPPATTTSVTGTSPTTPPASGCAALYGQCGGIGFTGPTCCSSGTCKVGNAYYSQCLS